MRPPVPSECTTKAPEVFDQKTADSIVAALPNVPYPDSHCQPESPFLTGGTPAPYWFLAMDSTAKPLNFAEFKKAIRYPPLAGCGQGSVILRVLINEEGYPLKYRVITELHPLFNKEVVDKLYLLRYRPAMLGGLPIKSWTILPIRFELK